MLTSFKRLLRSRLNRLGYGIYRFDPKAPPIDRRSALFRHLGVDLVIDVGANEGQYALGLRRMGYTGRMVSVEPLKSAFARLSAIASCDPDWDCFAFALGAREETAQLNVSSYSQSSSLLPMLPKTSDVAPEIRHIFTETVEVKTLDQCYSDFVLNADCSPYLKIDAQGYERMVLLGARSVLRSFVAVECELSLTPLYAGEPDMAEMMAFLDSLGFRPYDIQPGFADGRTGELLQVDMVFVPSSSRSTSYPIQ